MQSRTTWITHEGHALTAPTMTCIQILPVRNAPCLYQYPLLVSSSTPVTWDDTLLLQEANTLLGAVEHRQSCYHLLSFAAIFSWNDCSPLVRFFANHWNDLCFVDRSAVKSPATWITHESNSPTATTMKCIQILPVGNAASLYQYHLLVSSSSPAT